jgi:hypothetical protein
MDAQELHNLQEAYLDVYQELDEAMSNIDPDKLYRAYRNQQLLSGGRRKKKPENQETSTKSKPDTKSDKNESYDIYDIILSHLLDEGYAETPEAAEAIMVNMSEEWRESIVEADSIAAMKERAAKRRKQRYGASDTSRGGRDDFRPYTKDDYKKPTSGS